MDSNTLAQRAQLLQAEIQRAKQNVIALTEQLEQAKNHFNMVSGHINEIAYLMGEEKKLEQAQSAAVMDNLQNNSQEPEPQGEEGHG